MFLRESKQERKAERLENKAECLENKAERLEHKEERLRARSVHALLTGLKQLKQAQLTVISRS